MGTIQVKDREFEVFLKEEDIQKEIKRVAAEINRDYVGKEPLFLCILNGSFMFAADLLKDVNIPCNVSFVKVSSYQGTDTTGKVKELMGLQEDVEGRHIIIVEDIVDTGYTMRDVLDSLAQKKAASVQVCALLCKPDKLKVDINLKYLAMNIPNGFIVGYGLDYDGFGRNSRDIYKIVKE
ncbi:MAG: hypoxanthine phosphoribosyltransferase [Bacteroidaceae bacterium]|jgi:hypoxanthine phosphoribosyltransferase|nr:hypoxanthine phosphoribosyltransferase [Bacteroidaceae bacterium]